MAQYEMYIYNCGSLQGAYMAQYEMYIYNCGSLQGAYSAANIYGFARSTTVFCWKWVTTPV